jgi:hypothetical protein
VDAAALGGPRGLDLVGEVVHGPHVPGLDGAPVGGAAEGGLGHRGRHDQPGQDEDIPTIVLKKRKFNIRTLK